MEKFLQFPSGTSLKGNVKQTNIKAYRENGSLLNEFNSIKDCALYFGLSTTTITKILNNKNNFFFH